MDKQDAERVESLLESSSRRDVLKLGAAGLAAITGGCVTDGNEPNTPRDRRTSPPSKDDPTPTDRKTTTTQDQKTRLDKINIPDRYTGMFSKNKVNQDIFQASGSIANAKTRSRQIGAAAREMHDDYNDTRMAAIATGLVLENIGIEEQNLDFDHPIPDMTFGDNLDVTTGVAVSGAEGAKTSGIVYETDDGRQEFGVYIPPLGEADAWKPVAEDSSFYGVGEDKPTTNFSFNSYSAVQDFFNEVGVGDVDEASTPARQLAYTFTPAEYHGDLKWVIPDEKAFQKHSSLLTENPGQFPESRNQLRETLSDSEEKNLVVGYSEDNGEWYVEARGLEAVKGQLKDTLTSN